ncbi:MAG TPA: lmo0937 family membrane protein [Bryobacteraceae bacterium]|jgi:hypothetical protein
MKIGAGRLRTTPAAEDLEGFVNWREACNAGRQKGSKMLETIAVILLVMWLLGMVTSYTVGGFIHILLVLAIIMVLVRVIQGRRPI